MKTFITIMIAVSATCAVAKSDRAQFSEVLIKDASVRMQKDDEAYKQKPVGRAPASVPALAAPRDNKVKSNLPQVGSGPVW
jgi:hypothetical protein